ncbi:MAG: pyruvate dehydrogenase (acetyl-transferring), homodimeric type, partial [Gammaproteobacteria bacterium]
YGIKAEIWSITSFNELYRNAIEEERKKTFNLDSSKPYVEECFDKTLPTLAVSEYMRAHSNQIRQWINGDYLILGTDGFGRSDTREKLRQHFEISKEYIVFSCLNMLGLKKDADNYMKNHNIKISEEAPWLK